MTDVQKAILKEIWRGESPLESGNPLINRVDLQGWTSNHVYLTRAILEVRPRIIVEVGVWKGGSTITLATAAKSINLDCVVIAVDTWLGAAEHWSLDEWFPSLQIQSGYPTLFQTFSANIVESRLQDYVVPLPLDSINAAELLAMKGLMADVIHIDAGHSYESVMSDLRVWWPRLNNGGILIGDDYHPEGIDVWPDVRKAFNEFFQTPEIENLGGKCYIRKPLKLK